MVTSGVALVLELVAEIEPMAVSFFVQTLGRAVTAPPFFALHNTSACAACITTVAKVNAAMVILRLIVTLLATPIHMQFVID